MEKKVHTGTDFSWDLTIARTLENNITSLVSDYPLSILSLFGHCTLSHFVSHVEIQFSK